MATCGYICPACEGKGHDDNGNPCEWCSLPSVNNSVPLAGDNTIVEQSVPIEDEEWMKNTHEGNCCAGEE